MSNITNMNLDYSKPVKLAEDVFWVGFRDRETGTQANPYLILDGDEGVVIDSGSRSAFPTVMMKIMQTGIAPAAITGLIYQNNDARLCGSIPHLESIIDRGDLKILSDPINHMFIRHYSQSAAFVSLAEIDYTFHFRSGRTLKFIKIPYAPSSGSFMTFDPQSEILFSSDLFSSYVSEWTLFLDLPSRCRRCMGDSPPHDCDRDEEDCPVKRILSYHREIMTSERALKHAIDQVSGIPFKTIAPQQGSIIHDAEDILLLCELLSTLRGVGIDSIVGDRSFYDLGNIRPIRERMVRL